MFPRNFSLGALEPASSGNLRNCSTFALPPPALRVAAWFISCLLTDVVMYLHKKVNKKKHRSSWSEAFTFNSCKDVIHCDSCLFLCVCVCD